LKWGNIIQLYTFSKAPPDINGFRRYRTPSFLEMLFANISKWFDHVRQQSILTPKGYFDIYPSFKIPFSPKIIMFYIISCSIKKKSDDVR
jgi:hypothetical protein